MNKHLYYSILQYKHSPILGEAINVGILFYFPEEQTKLYFQMADSSRLSCIYEDFDSKYYNSILRIISKNAMTFSDKITTNGTTIKAFEAFETFIHKYLLKADDTVLQFSNPFCVINNFSDNETVVNEFTKLMLPLSRRTSKRIHPNEAITVNRLPTTCLH